MNEETKTPKSSTFTDVPREQVEEALRLEMVKSTILAKALQDLIDYHHHIGNEDCPYSNNQIMITLYNTAKKGLADAILVTTKWYTIKATRLNNGETYLINSGKYKTDNKEVADAYCKDCNNTWGESIKFEVIESK